MALYQPSNIIPSSFTVGTVSVSDRAQVSWQVNGTSPMTFYQIDFYTHDADDVTTQELVATTGKISKGIPSGGFYGTDRFGQPNIFTWDPETTWVSLPSSHFSNGQAYKFKITQWSNESEEGVEQIDFNVFITRTKPILQISTINNSSYSGGRYTLSSAVLVAGASYEQAEGDAVSSTRWQLVNADTREVIDDTGEVNTSVLVYEYDGLFNGTNAELTLTVITTSGITASTTAKISVSYTDRQYTDGKIIASCNQNRSAVSLAIQQSGSIPGTPIPNNGYSYGSSSLVLYPGAAIEWDQVQGLSGLSPMSFASPYFAAIKFRRSFSVLSPMQPSSLGPIHRIEIGGIRITETSSGLDMSFGGVTAPTMSLDGIRNGEIIIFLTMQQAYVQYEGTRGTEEKSFGVPSPSFSRGNINSISIENMAPQGSPTLYYSGTFSYIALYQGSNNTSLWNDIKAGYTPNWGDNSKYPAYFIARFDGTLDAGPTSLSLAYHLFRADDNSKGLTLVQKSKIGAKNIVDYGVVSGRTYQYYLFILDANNRFYGSIQTERIGVRLGNFSLVATTYNEEDGCYHVKEEFIFQGNVNQGDVSNNNAPQFNENFTQYPTRMGSIQNSKGGTLQALIGYVNSRNEYSESLDVEEELYSLSSSNYILFLRDTKGHIRMVQTASNVAQQYNLKSRAMQTTVTFPWREIGDASKCSIVKTEEDY